MITPSAFENSGLTILAPNQKVRVRVVSFSDGRTEIDALELMAARDEPAVAIAEAPSMMHRIRMREAYGLMQPGSAVR